MAQFQLNMARGLVLPLEIRKRWHRWLLVYVFVAALVCGTAFRRAMVEVEELKGEVARLEGEERLFREKHAGVGNLGEYGELLSMRLEGCVERLEAMSRFQTMGHQAAPLFMGLAVALPPGMEIGRFEVGNGKDVTFDIYVQADRRLEESMSPTRLVALWQKEPLLTGRIESFKTENSERVRVGGQNVLSWHFVARLAGGGQ